VIRLIFPVPLHLLHLRLNTINRRTNPRPLQYPHIEKIVFEPTHLSKHCAPDLDGCSGYFGEIESTSGSCTLITRAASLPAKVSQSINQVKIVGWRPLPSALRHGFDFLHRKVSNLLGKRRYFFIDAKIGQSGAFLPEYQFSTPANCAFLLRRISFQQLPQFPQRISLDLVSVSYGFLILT